MGAQRALGRVIFELRKDIVPRTAENFRALCTGGMGLGKTTKKPLHYKNCPVHRIIRSFMMQAGDFSNGNGTGGESIYGNKFADENFKLRHERAGLLSMANAGPGTNGSQFFVTFKMTPHLDGKHVVFGGVVRGMDIIEKLEMVPTGANDRPVTPINITDCGQLTPEEVELEVFGGKDPNAPPPPPPLVKQAATEAKAKLDDDERKRKRKEEKKAKKEKKKRKKEKREKKEKKAKTKKE